MFLVMNLLAAERGEFQGDEDGSSSNASMVDLLERMGAVRSAACRKAFLSVDRGHFWTVKRSWPGYASDAHRAYSDAPLKSGRLHQSAPHIYAMALEALMPLKPGMSFLNIGSGTGYFNSLVAEMLGESGVNDGLELWPENVAYAQERCSKIGKNNIEFTVGNIYQLDINLGTRYDRIYVGACACPRARYLYNLLEVGGVLVGPFQAGHSQQMRRVVRVSEEKFNVEVISAVHFATLVKPPASRADDDGWICGSSQSGRQDGAAERMLQGLPGVPFTFALRQQLWALQRNWAYPPQFRSAVAALLQHPSGSPYLPPEMWMQQILPWCPPWWFDDSQPVGIKKKLSIFFTGLASKKALPSHSWRRVRTEDEAEGESGEEEAQSVRSDQLPLVRRARGNGQRKLYRCLRRFFRCISRCCAARTFPSSVAPSTATDSAATAALMLSTEAAELTL